MEIPPPLYPSFPFIPLIPKQALKDFDKVYFPQDASPPERVGANISLTSGKPSYSNKVHFSVKVSFCKES
jgi:hypothetical protein